VPEGNVPEWLMKEEAWGLIVVVVVDSAEGRVKCTRLSAQSVSRNVMFHSSRVEIAQYIVKSVSRSGKMLAAKRS